MKTIRNPKDKAFTKSNRLERKRARVSRLLRGAGCGVQAVAASRRTVTVSVGRSDFYSPGEAVGRALAELVHRAESVLPVRKIDPSTIAAETPRHVRVSHRQPTSVNGRYWTLAWKVLRSAVGDETVVRSWARPGGGITYMMSDRVLLVRLGQDGHWSIVRVPEEGLDE